MPISNSTSSSTSTECMLLGECYAAYEFGFGLLDTISSSKYQTPSDKDKKRRPYRHLGSRGVVTSKRSIGSVLFSLFCKCFQNLIYTDRKSVV